MMMICGEQDKIDLAIKEQYEETPLWMGETHRIGDSKGFRIILYRQETKKTFTIVLYDYKNSACIVFTGDDSTLLTKEGIPL
tara:strand:- start:32 stop:277 length:246 start_codon:yes stop_codon:yes gene_type:complete